MLGLDMLFKSIGITPEMMKQMHNAFLETAARIERIEHKLDALAVARVLNSPIGLEHENGTENNDGSNA